MPDRNKSADEAYALQNVASELVDARDLFQTTLSSIGDAVIATDTKGDVTFLNPEAERLTGWQNDEATGQPLQDVFRIINERTGQPAENPVDKVLRTGKVQGLANHTVLISKKGVETAIDDSAAPIRHGSGSAAGVVLVFRDVTEQRKAQQSSELLASIVQHSGDAIVTKNLKSEIQSWNSSAEKMFGYREDEVVGKPVTIIFPPDRLAEEDHIIGLLKQGKALERFETIRVSKDGRNIPVEVTVSPLRDGEGNIIGASKILRDISEIIEARSALEREKQLLATTLGSIGDAVIVTDELGRVSFQNAEAIRMTRWDPLDAVGRPLPEVFRIVNEETRAPVENPVEKVLRLGGVVGLANHTLLIAKDGTETPIDDSAAPICEPGGELFGVVLVFRDFTRRREAERSQAQFVRMIDSSFDAIIVRDERDRITRWNRGAEVLYGWTSDEAVGKVSRELFRTQLPNVSSEMLADVVEAGSWEGEQVHTRKDGSEIIVFSKWTLENDEGRRTILEVNTDITARKKAEAALAHVQQELIAHAADLEGKVGQRTTELQKTIEELQGLSYSIAHDMRAPLRAMASFAHLLMQEVPAVTDSDVGRAYCERIISGAKRLDSLINDALNYTRTVLEDVPLHPVELDTLIRGLLDTYPNLQGDAADIQIQGKLPVVIGNESLLTQCFSNLLGNAVKFVAPRKRAVVRVWAEAKGDRARIWCKDQGIGIPAHAHPRLFGIFQKLDSQYEGAGIGLAIVRKAVERMGGSIGLESEVNVGTAFWVDLNVPMAGEST